LSCTRGYGCKFFKLNTVHEELNEKKKILVLSDHPLSPSGVGTQTKYMIEALLKTGRYQFLCLGGAMKHDDYTPFQKLNLGVKIGSYFPSMGMVIMK
jgi:hypothetical protein